MNAFRILLMLLLAGAVVGAHAAAGSVVTTPQVRAELIVQAPEGVVGGRSVQLGLKIEHQPHWHTYWKNPGDSGLPTQLQWTLPPGFNASEIHWPAPSRLPIGPLMNYGYEGTLLLPVTVAVPADFKGESLPVTLHADWLVCKDVCIPESGDFRLDIPARAASAGDSALFAAAGQEAPQDAADARATATVDNNALVVRIAGLPAAWRGQAISWFPETAGVINNAAKQTAAWEGDTWRIQLPLDPQRSESPKLLPSVLRLGDTPGGLRVQVEVTSAWPAAAPAPAALPALLPETATTPAPTAGAAAPAPLPTLGWALLLALVGGSLLNLMPCVFPVLSLKVLGFAASAGKPEARRALVAGGVAYTVGVVGSFVALAGLLLVLRQAGEQFGWGFQLQSPLTVALLAALFTLIGLNLLGVFEVGTLLPNSWATARARNPMVDSLLTGILAVAVASPCTAPFMSASLGLALTLPTLPALSIFAALGLGMALPYLALSAWPALADRLPRPGAWMLHFKVAMAFPMFATVVWLVWVLGQQAGIDGAAALLLLLLALAFLAWVLGASNLGLVSRRVLRILGVVVAGAALFWAAPAIRQEATAADSPARLAGEWQAWSPDRVAQAQAAGQAVFVDFTAAWCVSCQVNERTTLAASGVQQAFRDHKVLLLRADWTRRDPLIAAELARLGRQGVPVYALYPAGGGSPRLLNEILTPGEVHEALAQLPSPTKL